MNVEVKHKPALNIKMTNSNGFAIFNRVLLLIDLS